MQGLLFENIKKMNMRYILIMCAIVFQINLVLGQESKVQKKYDDAWRQFNSFKYDSALLTFKEHNKLLLGTANYQQQSLGYIGLGYSFFYLDEYEELSNSIGVFLKVLPQSFKDTSNNVYRLYTYYALGYYERGDYANAYNIYKDAEILAENNNFDNKDLIYTSLVSVSLRRGDSKQAAEYALKNLEHLRHQNRKAVEIYKAKYDYVHANANEISIENSINEYHNLLLFGRNVKSLTRKKKIETDINQNLALRHYEIHNYDSAIWYVKKVINSNKNSFDKIPSYYLLADIYGQKGLFQQANDNIAISLNLWKEHLITKQLKNIQQSYQLAKIHIKKGKLHTYQSQHLQAAQNYQLSISYYLADFFNKDIYTNPTLNTTNAEDALMYAIAYKAAAMTQLSLETNSQKDRDMAIETYQLAMKLVDKMRQQFEAQGSKSFLATRVWWVFESAIKSCLELYEATGEEKYQQYAFQFAEKSKAVLIQDAVSESLAQQQVDVPDSLLDEEHELKVDITYIENELFQAERKKKEEKASELRTKLLAKREELRLFALRLKEEYPNYHELKYNQTLANVGAIQAGLSDNQAIVEYFVGDSSVYSFTLTNQNLFIHSFAYDQTLAEQVKKLREGLSPKKQSTDNRSYLLFTQSAYELHQRILAKVMEKLPSGINKLTIIPDGELSYVPFEVLLTAPADEEIADYRAPAYLIKKYQINYAYSASLLTSKLNNLRHATEEGVLAFAPSYPKSINDSVQLQQLGQFRDQVTPLIWNTKEVKQIAEYLPTTYFTNQEATESEFKKLASQYRIIHLAMHALVDDEHPMGSKLVFTNTDDQQEDSYLNVYELYNMKLNADLAILSACNTGYGKYVRGEGLVSLGRAFAYAGCPSVVISHWSVDDQATSQLMQIFYKGLSKGLDKTEAMRQAKLTYLENTGPREANPIYWGSFVLIGDDAPIEQGFTWWWLAVGLLVLGAVAVIMKKVKTA